MRAGPGRRRGGIHGGETVVERQGTTKQRTVSRPRGAGGQSIRLRQTTNRLLILFSCKMSMARWEILN